MSNQHYQNQWKEAINDLLENFELENYPLDQAIATQKYERKAKEWTAFYAPLYLNYLDTYKKLEAVYDQMVHPQKRKVVRTLLDSCITRILEIKNDLITFNIDTKAIGSDFVNLDQMLFQLKILPERFEVPIPRFFKEDNFKEMHERDQIFEAKMLEIKGTDQPETEQIVLQLPMELTDISALWTIQKTERGRQAINMGQKRRQEMLRLKRAEQAQVEDGAEQDEHVQTIQKYFLGYLARKIVSEKRDQELLDLGMKQPVINKEDPKGIYKKIDNIRDEMKSRQTEYYKQMLKDTEKIRQEQKEITGPDIKEELLKQRHEDIIDYYESKFGKALPKNVDELYEIYDKKNVGVPLTPEQEDAKRKIEEEKKKAAKKAKEGKGKKKETEEEAFMRERAPKGPQTSLAIKPYKSAIEDYADEWEPKDEAGNFEQRHDRDLIMRQVYPEVEEEIKAEVKELVKVELENLYVRLNIAKKKPPKPRRVKPKRVKPVKLPGANLVGKNVDMKSMFPELIEAEVLKKVPPQKLEDFKGDYNTLRSLIEAQSDKQPDPSLAQLRQTIVEQVAIPLGTGINLEGTNRTFLFYGPQGSGKSLMSHILASQCNAWVFDLSPDIVAEQFVTKQDIARILYVTFAVAKLYQPSIIWIDEIEHFFPARKKKKGKGPVIGKCAKFKKDLMAHVSKHLSPSDKVVVIGSSYRPYLANVKDLGKFFYKKFYFPFPDYGARGQIFKHLVEKNGGKLNDQFPLQLLSHLTEGYTPGSFDLAIKQVLSFNRKKNLMMRPLCIDDFVHKISEQYTCSAEEYELFRTFTDQVTGQAARRQAAEDEDDPKKKKKKK